MTQTVASIQDKTPEELNVICAELCGVDPESHWWCPTCKCDVASSHVTYEETHDVCFSMVEIRDAPPYATSYDAILGEIHKLTDGQIKKFGSFICNLMRPPHVRIPEAWTADQHELIGDVIHRIFPADLTRALILTKQTNEETK